jgi:aspartyl protease family protein
MFQNKLRSPRARDEPSGEAIGRWMVYAAWILLIGLLTFLFSRWLDLQNNPNRHLLVSSDSTGETQLTLNRNRMGHYVAPGRINGVPVVFLLDTGATNVAVPDDLANRIGLERGLPITSMTANGLVRSWLTELRSVELGPLEMSGVKASILPNMPGSEVLLGMSFLRHLELIQRDGQLILKLPQR